MVGICTLAKYPFLSGAHSYVKDNNISLDELLKSKAYAEVRRAGKKRVMDVIERREVERMSGLHESDCILEFLAYTLSRILVSCVADEQLKKWYSLAEARRIERELESEGIDFVISATGELGVPVKKEGESARMHFLDYVKYTHQIKSKEWKIVNKDLDRGYIVLQKKDLTRLLREVLRTKFDKELPLPVTKEIIWLLVTDVKEINAVLAEKKKEYKANDFGPISITKMPPCIKQLLGMMQAGENVSHAGRFALTAFLHTIGMSVEQIIEVFSTAPDFDVGKSRYQIEHITGVGSGTEYTPQACKTMKTSGICYNPDSLCKQVWMTHPLKYYRVKDKEKGRIAAAGNKQGDAKKTPGETANKPEDGNKTPTETTKTPPEDYKNKTEK